MLRKHTRRGVGVLPLASSFHKRSRSRRAEPFDADLMRRAIALAGRGEGRVEPNPLVGCVIARNGRVLGEGYHRRFGGPHAEIAALRSCCDSPRGATVYVSLEPCCHQGKTPPCTDALIRAGVKRVVVAVRDPHPAVAGRGIKRLRAAGISVRCGVGAEPAAEMLAPYLTRLALGRPYVIAKWAQSLDGALVVERGQSQWISCEASRRRVHCLRARVDAILAGSGTVRADNPMLTARDVPIRRQAVRVVVDGRLRLSPRCRLAATATTVPTLVFTGTSSVRTPKAERLRERGVEVIACRARRGRLVLEDCLRELARRDVTNLLVEGGPTLLRSFFQAALVDEAQVFVAPRLIGGQAEVSVIDALRVMIIRGIHTRKSGTDILYRIRFANRVHDASGRGLGRARLLASRKVNES